MARLFRLCFDFFVVGVRRNSQSHNACWNTASIEKQKSIDGIAVGLHLPAALNGAGRIRKRLSTWGLSARLMPCVRHDLYNYINYINL
jgi:hypothetical protein